MPYTVTSSNGDRVLLAGSDKTHAETIKKIIKKGKNKKGKRFKGAKRLNTLKKEKSTRAPLLPPRISDPCGA